MPSFLRRLAGITSGSIQFTKEDTKQSSQQRQQKKHQQQQQRSSSKTNSNVGTNIAYELTQELVKRSSPMSNESNISSTSSSSSSHTSSKASDSAAPTMSSSSSLSLAFIDAPSSAVSAYTPSRRQSSEALGKGLDHSNESDMYSVTQQPRAQSMDHTRELSSSSSSSSSKESPPASTLVQNQNEAYQRRGAQRSSMPSLSALFHPRSKSMSVLQDIPASRTSSEYQTWLNQSTVLSPVSTTPGSKRQSMDELSHKSRRMSENLSLGTPSTPSSPISRGKKMRPKSLSSLLLQQEQQLAGVQPRLPHQPKSTRWANRGGIGTNEMMVDLETTGVFVPSSGQRLRAEFVYRTVIQCADEIRHRGLDHQNIFHNPSPKKVISAMIALLIDQNRCDLYSIRYLRIDTVAGLMLNLLSQMSNPVIPYAVMEHYFKQGGASTTRSPTLSSPTPSQRSRPQPSSIQLGRTTTTTSSNSDRTSSPISTLLPTIPVLPPRGSSQATIAWAREYFDLPAFLDVLPSMNRVILLEVLHLCQELLEHQIWNRVTISRLAQQVAPALFSTVFDQKILESMAGGSRRCSIHGDSISPEEGTRAENHLFTVVLVRFLYLTANTFHGSINLQMNGGPVPLEAYAENSSGEASTTLSSAESVYDLSNDTIFRKSQERLRQEQQEYHERVARSYQEMEIHQQPLQHFGVYSASQKQQHHEQRQKLQQQEEQDQVVPHLNVSMNAKYSLVGEDDLGAGTKSPREALIRDFILPEAALKRAQHDHLCHIPLQTYGPAIPT